MTDANDGAPNFDRDIKPRFREGDRSSMLAFFDLWSFDDVKENAGAILEAVRSGSMPCDGAWSGQKVDLRARAAAAFLSSPSPATPTSAS